MRSPNNNNGRRGRNRSGRRPQQTNRNTVYESNGPEAKVRGNAAQVYEKYTTLARDAASAGDHVRAEGLLQHAEHYLRIVNTQKATEKPNEKGANNSQNQNQNNNSNNNSQQGERQQGAGQATASDPSEQPQPKPEVAGEGDQPSIEPVVDQPAADAQADASAQNSAPAKPKRRRAPKREAKSEEKAPKAKEATDSDQPAIEVIDETPSGDGQPEAA